MLPFLQCLLKEGCRRVPEEDRGEFDRVIGPLKVELVVSVVLIAHEDLTEHIGRSERYCSFRMLLVDVLEVVAASVQERLPKLVMVQMERDVPPTVSCLPCCVLLLARKTVYGKMLPKRCLPPRPGWSCAKWQPGRFSVSGYNVHDTIISNKTQLIKSIEKEAIFVN